MAENTKTAPEAKPAEKVTPPASSNHRTLQVSILRYNPADSGVPHLQTYQVSETDSMTLYILLNELVRDTRDPSPGLTSFAVPGFAVPALC